MLNETFSVIFKHCEVGRVCPLHCYWILRCVYSLLPWLWNWGHAKGEKLLKCVQGEAWHTQAFHMSLKNGFVNWEIKVEFSPPFPSLSTQRKLTDKCVLVEGSYLSSKICGVGVHWRVFTQIRLSSENQTETHFQGYLLFTDGTDASTGQVQLLRRPWPPPSRPPPNLKWQPPWAARPKLPWWPPEVRPKVPMQQPLHLLRWPLTSQ